MEETKDIIAIGVPMHLAVLSAITFLTMGQAPAEDASKAFIAAKNWPGLEAWARAEIIAHPIEAKSYLLLGMALGSQGRSTDAVSVFREVTVLTPDKVEGWFDLCLAGAQVPDRAAVVEGLDGVALRNFDATLRLLQLPAVARVLGSDEPAAREDFSRIRVRFQPSVLQYPPEAKAHRVQGTVVTEITQDRDGRVIKSRVIDGPDELRRAAEAYLTAWRFAPIPETRKDDRICFRLNIVFRLR